MKTARMDGFRPFVAKGSQVTVIGLSGFATKPLRTAGRTGLTIDLQLHDNPAVSVVYIV